MVKTHTRKQQDEDLLWYLLNARVNSFHWGISERTVCVVFAADGGFALRADLPAGFSVLHTSFHSGQTKVTHLNPA